MKRLLFISLLFFVTLALKGQKQANIWCFGRQMGLDFNQQPPAVFLDPQLWSDFGSSSIADSTGRLLFYTDGQTIWNRFHKKMPNGTGLFGNGDAITSALIVRQGFGDVYYVFTSDGSYEYPSVNLGVHYSVVDMAADSGRGDVVKKNCFLHRNAAEKIAGVRHVSNKDAWIVTAQLFTDSLHTYRLTDTGLSEPVFNRNPGAILPGGNTGHMKFSPDGKHLAYIDAALGNDMVYLLDFDARTGVLSNPRKVSGIIGPLSLEFSPSGKFLYVKLQYSIDNVHSLFQISVDKLLSDTGYENVSEKMLLPHSLGTLQLATDGKIYIVTSFNLICIHKPDELGAAMQLDFTGIKTPFGSNHNNRGLPAFLSSYFAPAPYVISRNPCVSDSMYFKVENAVADSVRWIWGDGTHAVTGSYEAKHCYKTKGEFAVKVVLYRLNTRDTILYYAEVRGVPKPDLGKDTFLCLGKHVYLNAYNPVYMAYNWSNGKRDARILVDTPGVYAVQVNDRYCKASDTFVVAYGRPGTVYIGPDTAFCHAFSKVLKANGVFQSYLWNSGDTSFSLLVSKAGTYSLKVKDKYACEDSDTIQIEEIKRLNALIEFDTVNCLYTVIKINPQANVRYVWSTGDTGTSILIKQKGQYALTQISNYCARTDTFRVDVLSKPEIDLGHDTVLCFSSLRLMVNEKGNYLWSTGETGTSIIVRSAGIYSLQISRNGCMSSDTIHIRNCLKAKFFIPTAFSPDGNGKNEVFSVFGENISDVRLAIFNRWGEQISETGGVDAFWDGTYQGQSCPQDVYLYTIRVTGLDGSNDFVSGLIHLLR